MHPSLCNKPLRSGHADTSSPIFLPHHILLQNPVPFPKPFHQTRSQCRSHHRLLSYGVSRSLIQESHLSLSTQFRLRTTEKADSILRLLKDHGFTETHIARIIARRPKLLNAKPELSLKPELEFFRVLGFSGPLITSLFTSNHDLFMMSLEKKITPFVNFLISIIKTNKGVADVIKSTTSSIVDDRNPNFKILKAIGASDFNVSRLLVTMPRALVRSPDKFSEMVAEVKGMGIDPSSMMFLQTVGVMSYMSKVALERKRSLYRSLGWSDCEILNSIRKQPSCLAVLDSVIKQKLEFFYRLGLSPSFIEALPQMLLYSFKKRILPRSMVFEKLKSRGIFKADEVLLATMLVKAEQDFVERFVMKYEKEIPDFVKAFRV